MFLKIQTGMYLLILMALPAAHLPQVVVEVALQIQAIEAQEVLLKAQIVEMVIPIKMATNRK